MTNVNLIFFLLEDLSADFVVVNVFNRDGDIRFSTSIQRGTEEFFHDDDDPLQVQLDLESLVKELVSPFINIINHAEYRFYYNNKQITSKIDFN